MAGCVNFFKGSIQITHSSTSFCTYIELKTIFCAFELLLYFQLLIRPYLFQNLNIVNNSSASFLNFFTTLFVRHIHYIM